MLSAGLIMSTLGVWASNNVQPSALTTTTASSTSSSSTTTLAIQTEQKQDTEILSEQGTAILSKIEFLPVLAFLTKKDIENKMTDDVHVQLPFGNQVFECDQKGGTFTLTTPMKIGHFTNFSAKVWMYDRVYNPQNPSYPYFTVNVDMTAKEVKNGTVRMQVVERGGLSTVLHIITKEDEIAKYQKKAEETLKKLSAK